MVFFELLTHTYKHSWQDICLASWQKYPCAERPDVLSVDIIDKRFYPEEGLLYTKRLVQMRLPLPYWLTRMINSNFFFLEEAVVDRNNKKMILSARNICFSKFITMTETIVYSPHPDNSKWTNMHQLSGVDTQVDCGLSTYLDRYGRDSYVKNAKKGRHIMEQAVVRLKREAEESIHTVKEGLDTVKEITNAHLLPSHALRNPAHVSLEAKKSCQCSKVTCAVCTGESSANAKLNMLD